MPVEWKNVFSDRAQAVGHDAEKRELHVRWKNGKVSVYSDVAADVAEDIANSWSVGQALNEAIIGRKKHRYE